MTGEQEAYAQAVSGDWTRDLRIYVLEKDATRRRLVERIASSITSASVIGEAELVGSEIEAAAPDIVLIDSDLAIDQIGALLDYSDKRPGIRYVVYADVPEVKTLLSLRRLPVMGFLAFNHLSAGEFQHALEIISFGGAVLDPSTTKGLLSYLRVAPLFGESRNPHVASLSEREVDVLRLIKSGLSNKEIAQTLSIKVGTVRAHVASIFRKLGVSSRAGAAAIET